MADTFASHVTLNASESLFLQTLVRSVIGSTSISQAVAFQANMPVDAFRHECGALSAKIKNDLLVPTTVETAQNGRKEA